MSETQNIEYKFHTFAPESETTEYKERLTDSLEKETVAFLNAKGGSIYIGIADDGNVIGVHDIDKLQLQIKDRLIFGISPSIMSLVAISAETIDNKNVLKITLKEGSEKPYYIKNKGLSESGAFIRIGSSAQPMTREMIFSQLNSSIAKSLINIESPEQDLTFGDLLIHYNRVKKPLNDAIFAKTLNFLTKTGAYNYLAYLMADNNQNSVRFARFNDAGERFELIEKAIEYGNCCLITAIHKILDRYDVENITRTRLTGAAQRIDTRLVDEKCLREAVINAFAHNDYSYGMLPIFEVFQNRFAIRSYGGLVPQLTRHDFFLGVSALRNPELMRILKDLELVEALGFGIRGITKIYDKNIFEFTDNSLYVTFPFEEKDIVKSKGENISNATDNQENDENENKGIINKKSKGESKGENEGIRGIIIQLMKRNPKITVVEIAERSGLSISGIEKNIRQLKKEGRITREGATKNGDWIVNRK